MKTLDAVARLAREARLYPALILHGGEPAGRRREATTLARTLLCEEEAADRPCGRCRACRRIVWPGESDAFHPDFQVLVRDLRTSTSADATKRFLSPAFSAPFEARGQVFVVAEADTLSPEAADALLKVLEEPPTRSARHFLLLAPSRLDLLPTLRSRSLSVFLGSGEPLADDEVEQVGTAFGTALDGFLAGRSTAHLLAASEALAEAGGWEDPRARRPWAIAAAAILRYVGARELEPTARRALLALAEDLIDGTRYRLRGIGQGRILDGLVARHLADLGAGPGSSRLETRGRAG